MLWRNIKQGKMKGSAMGKDWFPLIQLTHHHLVAFVDTVCICKVLLWLQRLERVGAIWQECLIEILVDFPRWEVGSWKYSSGV